jgi:hypothetical protein
MWLKVESLELRLVDVEGIHRRWPFDNPSHLRVTIIMRTSNDNHC